MPDSTLINRYLGEGAASYNRARQSSTRWQRESAIVEQLLQAHSGRTVLDLPIGTGRFLPVYKELGCWVRGIDLSPDMLNQAKHLAAKIGFTSHQFQVGDALHIDPKTIEADVGIVIRFLNWLPASKAERAFKNIAAAIREELIIGLTSIDESQFGDRRGAIERRLANAHAKPAGEGLPPNGPHSWTAFKRWTNEAGFVIRDSILLFEGKDHLKGEIHRLARY